MGLLAMCVQERFDTAEPADERAIGSEPPRAERETQGATIAVMFAPTGMRSDHPERHLHQIFQGL
jgi:hypothetical protein